MRKRSRLLLSLSFLTKPRRPRVIVVDIFPAGLKPAVRSRSRLAAYRISAFSRSGFLKFRVAGADAGTCE